MGSWGTGDGGTERETLFFEQGRSTFDGTLPLLTCGVNDPALTSYMDTPATVPEDSLKRKKRKKKPRQLQNLIEKTGVRINFHVKQQMCRPPPDYYDGSGLHASFKTAMCGALEGEKVLLLAEQQSPLSQQKGLFGNTI